MGRHRTAEEKRQLGEQARALREAGRSRREIQAELGIGDDLAKALLRGVPLPDRLRRPLAKDDVRAAAEALRAQGLGYAAIAARLSVSKSSLSLWLRDLPRPVADPDRVAEHQQERLEALRARAARDRAERDRVGDETRRKASEDLAGVTPRDLVVSLAVSYWCEGAKRKPWNRQRAVQWMNSDPALVLLFLEGLAQLGVDPGRLVLRLHIHETADEAEARAWWAELTGVPQDQFRRSTIKRHNPLTPRRNTGPEYRGCLCVSVLGGRHLYDVLEGLMDGLTAGAREPGQWQDGASAAGNAPRGATPSAVG